MSVFNLILSLKLILQQANIAKISIDSAGYGTLENENIDEPQLFVSFLNVDMEHFSHNEIDTHTLHIT